MIDAQTKYVAIFGDPVSHSLSPQMHNAAFNHLGLNMAYLAFKVEQAADAATAMRRLGIFGASITVPHKESIIPHLDGLDEMSRAIGAVNTVFAQEGRLLGYNTDGSRCGTSDRPRREELFDPGGGRRGPGCNLRAAEKKRGGFADEPK